MKKWLIVALLVLESFSGYSQFRYADVDLKLISHEQYAFLKGPWNENLIFKITNFGPDTIKQKDTFILSGRYWIETWDDAPKKYEKFALDYELPPGVSFTWEWPLLLNMKEDYNKSYLAFQVACYTKDKIGDPLADEGRDRSDNNVVTWWFTYRSATSSIAELDASKLNIWPNPARDEVHLTLPDGWEFANCAVSMHSLQGALLQSLPLRSNGSISVAHLPAGMYVLEVRNAEAVVRKKLMVLR